MTKLRKSLIVVFLLVLLTGVFITSASAMDIGLTTSEMSEESKQSRIEYSKIKVTDQEPDSKRIACFDVSENGIIALGYNDNFNPKAYIGVYDETFKFLYTIEYYDLGSYYVKWDGYNLAIISVRGDVAISVSQTGEIVDIRSIDDTNENEFYMRNTIKSNERMVNGKRYIARNKGLFKSAEGNYAQFVVVDSEGNETILFDRSSNANATFWIIFAIVNVFLGVFAIYFVLRIKKNKARAKAYETHNHSDISI